MSPIRYSLGPALLSLSLLLPARAHAAESVKAGGGASGAEPAPASSPPLAERVPSDDGQPAVESPVEAAAAPPAAEQAPLEPVVASEAQSPPSPAPSEPAARPGRDPFLERVLMETAAHERRQRFAEGLLGLTGAGALVGTGFAAEGPDMTASHWLWVSGGVVALGSLASLFIPSPFEHFAGEAAGKSDAELRARWQKLAEQARVERRVGAVLGTLVGGAAIALGVLTLEDQVWNLSNDARLIVGTGMVTGGAFGVTKGVIDWFVPTSIERGYALVTEPPKLALSLSGAPQGFGLGVKGVFQ